ncbi:MAG: pyridoxal-phosphate dependent enzyme [Deltaproteobacteria bacterium]|nr:pyridoxal-phosphate dependent enzyme [Deltaproteobacteria bacterium]
METKITLELIESLRGVVEANTRRTPLLRSEWLSKITGGEVFLKCENLQLTGSFKIRGGFAALALDQPKSAVATSAGNHGQGLAVAARTLGIPCTIVVPRSVPKIKEDAIRGYGATVVKAPCDGYDGTAAWAEEYLGKKAVAPNLSAFDHPGVVAGNGGTTALEIFEDVSDLDAVIVPCGGGGCAIGIGVAAQEKSPGTEVIGVNTDASPGMWFSRRDRRPHLKVESRPTIADGIEGGISARSYKLAEKYINDIVVTKETTIRRAVREFALRERMIAEGSGVAGVAALLDGLVQYRRVCVVITGANIDHTLFNELMRETD